MSYTNDLFYRHLIPTGSLCRQIFGYGFANCNDCVFLSAFDVYPIILFCQFFNHVFKNYNRFTIFCDPIGGSYVYRKNLPYDVHDPIRVKCKNVPSIFNNYIQKPYQKPNFKKLKFLFASLLFCCTFAASQRGA